ncbi:unnamed protein product [Toxocara canis]|uniref:Uncharacterized protein n=1 Tax=Toxocara canis TaxID=6265 RepID=A0A183U5A1_TOXCA|nr:unnamed protein product [Toxocara canis]
MDPTCESAEKGLRRSEPRSIGRSSDALRNVRPGAATTAIDHHTAATGMHRTSEIQSARREDEMFNSNAQTATTPQFRTKRCTYEDVEI